MARRLSLRGSDRLRQKPGWMAKLMPILFLAGLAWLGWTVAGNVVFAWGSRTSSSGDALTRGELASAMDAVLHEAQIERHAGGDRRTVCERLRGRGLIERFPDGEFHPELPVRKSELSEAWSRLIEVLSWHRGTIGDNPVARYAHSISGNTGRQFAGRADLDALRRATEPLFQGSPLQESPRLQLKQLVQEQTASDEHDSLAPEVLASSPGKPAGSAVLASGDRIVGGRVLDALTGKPIADAVLSVAGKALRTGTDGAYPADGLPVGELLEFLVTADGYRSLTVKRRLTAGKPEGVSFRLNPQRAVFEGRIVSSADGKPLADVSGTIGDRGFKTDGAGRFRLQGLKPGYVTLDLTGKGYQKSRELIFLEEKNAPRTIRLDPDLG